MSAQPATTSEARYVASRTVAAAPGAVYALLTDPAQHHRTEPTDWVRGPLEAEPAPLTQVGQVFGIEMFHENAGGRYDMHNEVIALEPERTVAWRPGQYGPDGELGSAGWTWRYDLAAEGEGTRVTLTYDWSKVPEFLREQFSLPPFPPSFLDESLAALEEAVTAG
ncbi:SRPBCC family protein [Brachybacterium saurashtrense]|uniref:ATPase n=1 Tax=Brachybacterium saurashtrense TaxID=556288 RepID=A0A345YS30_9MICO|nr:SRPBCC family protein [Brachybacterium saurashtrense]AXK46732.1 ATPase [Brachybacterium saurashtrense]RRR22447.1 ATPase [Brachybacterium saurashtrense]